MIWPLDKVFKFNYLAPYKMRCDILIHYFGEKIALYFVFIIYYASSIIPLSIIGIIGYLLNLGINYLEDDNNGDDTYKILGTIINYCLGYGIVIWSVMFFI